MTLIKNTSYTLLLLVLSIAFSQCGSSKHLENNTPFIVGHAYTNQNESTTTLYIPIESNNTYVLDSVYYLNQAKKLEQAKHNLYTATFNTAENVKRDYNLHANPQQEFGNTTSKPINQSPFPLTATECIITFKQNNKTKYSKISSIIKKQVNTNYETSSN